MLVRWVLPRDLLARHELEADDDQRRGEEEKGEPERRAEELRRVGERVRECVDEDESDRAERRETEQGEHGELRGWVRRLRRNDPRFLRLRSPTAPPDEEDERRHDRVSDAAHERNRLPSSRQSTISAGIARNQVTSPSGTGPSKPSPQPPGRAGFFVNST